MVEAFDGTVFKKNITVLGAAFKPHSDDIRDSPALDVAVRLRGLGAWVTVTDPEALANAARVHPQLDYVEDRDEALRGADAVIVVTEWDEYRRELDPAHAASLDAGAHHRRRPQLPGCRGLACGRLDVLRHGTPLTGGVKVRETLRRLWPSLSRRSTR